MSHSVLPVSRYFRSRVIRLLIASTLTGYASATLPYLWNDTAIRSAIPCRNCRDTSDGGHPTRISSGSTIVVLYRCECRPRFRPVHRPVVVGHVGMVVSEATARRVGEHGDGEI